MYIIYVHTHTHICTHTYINIKIVVVSLFSVACLTDAGKLLFSAILLLNILRNFKKLVSSNFTLCN